VAHLQPTPDVVVVIVVANAGDTSEPQVLVLATLTPLLPTSKGSGRSHGETSAGSRAATSSVVSERVGSLTPGDSRYLQLPPLRVADGRAYRLEVSAGNGTLAALTDEVTDTFVIQIAS